MEKEVGGGIGMGNTCKPMAVSFQGMTKFTTNKKKKEKKSEAIHVHHTGKSEHESRFFSHLATSLFPSCHILVAETSP